MSSGNTIGINSVTTKLAKVFLGQTPVVASGSQSGVNVLTANKEATWGAVRDNYEYVRFDFKGVSAPYTHFDSVVVPTAFLNVGLVVNFSPKDVSGDVSLTIGPSNGDVIDISGTPYSNYQFIVTGMLPQETISIPVEVQKIKARSEFTSKDLKSISVTYEMATGADGQHGVVPVMTECYLKGDIEFTPANKDTFTSGTAVTTYDESCWLIKRDATLKITTKIPNFTDADVDNDGQGVPVVCLVVNGVIKKLEGSLWTKDNGISSICYKAKAGEKLQVGLLSGNVDGGDIFRVIDSINESDTHLAIPDEDICVLYIEIEEV